MTQLSPRALSVLLQISDSALPTGAFSHSFGMEQYLSREQIYDTVTFQAWLRIFIRTQLTSTDALAIRLAYEAHDVQVSVARLSELIAVSAIPEQVRTASAAMARRLRTIGQDALGFPPPTTEPVHPALEFAQICHHAGIDARTTAQAHLATAVTSLTQNAVRGIPLGQSDGQAVIAAAHPDIMWAIDSAAEMSWQDLGAVAPGLEIAQMQHERLRARMFMS